MKIISFFLSVLVHLIFVLFFILILKSVQAPIKSRPIYTVNIITLPRSKPKPRLVEKKRVIHKLVLKKTRIMEPKRIIKKSPIVLPRKRRVIKHRKIIKKLEKKKKNIYKKKREIVPNIEKKIQLLRERVLLNKIREELLREKINALREHILSKEEAEKAYLSKLSASYINLIQSIIYNNWGVEKSVIQNKILIAKVEIKLDYLGNLIKLKIVKSSGNSYFDGTVINAIKNSEPFPKPPKDILTAGTVEFIITFDSREKK